MSAPSQTLVPAHISFRSKSFAPCRPGFSLQRNSHVGLCKTSSEAEIQKMGKVAKLDSTAQTKYYCHFLARSAVHETCLSHLLRASSTKRAKGCSPLAPPHSLYVLSPFKTVCKPEWQSKKRPDSESTRTLLRPLS